MKRHIIILAAVAALSGGSVMADALSINFDSYTLGNLPGGNTGTDNRTPGNGQWWYPSNAATSGQVVNVGAGNNALLVTNNGTGNDGVVNNVVSPQLVDLAGQTGSHAQAGATANVFTSSFQFHTQNSAPTAAAGAFQFKTETYGADRTTWLEFANDASGNLIADYSGVQDPTHVVNGDIFTDAYSGTLNWGDTYTVNTTIHFGSGPDSDVVNVSIYDDTLGSTVWTHTDTTWADYYLYDTEQSGNGNIMPGADAVQFQMRDSAPGLGGVYVDNLSYSTSVVPLPSAAWGGFALLGGLGLLGTVKRMRKQTA